MTKSPRVTEEKQSPDLGVQALVAYGCLWSVEEVLRDAREQTAIGSFQLPLHPPGGPNEGALARHS